MSELLFLLKAIGFFSIVGILLCHCKGKQARAATQQGTPMQSVLLAAPVPIMAVSLRSSSIIAVNNAFSQYFTTPSAQSSLLAAGFINSNLDLLFQETLHAIPPSAEGLYLPSSPQQTTILWQAQPHLAPLPVQLSLFAIASPHTNPIIYLHCILAGGSLSRCIQQYYTNDSGKMFFLRDAQGAFISCSQEFEEFVGISFEQIIGKTVAQLPLPASIIETVIHQDEKGLATGSSYSYEMEVSTGTNKTNLYLSQNIPDILPSGQLLGIFSVLKAVSGSRAATLLLKQQEKLLVATIDAIMCLFAPYSDMDAICQNVFSVLGKAISADFIDLWKNHQSTDSSPIAGHLFRWFESTHPTEHVIFPTSLSYTGQLAGWDKLLANGECIKSLYTAFEQTPVGVDEYDKYGSILVVPVLYQNTFWGFIRIGVKNNYKRWSKGEEAVLRAIGLFLVSTMQQRQVQTALEESERRLQDVMHAADEIVWELDAEGYISHMSDRITLLIGYTPAEMIGTRFEDYASPANPFSFTGELFQKSVAHGFFKSLEHRFISKEGSEVWLLSSGQLLTGDEGITGLRGVSLDITQRKQDGERLAQMLTALEQANDELALAAEQAHMLAEKAEQANKAKTNFIANMSHELRTPLNAILGMAYLAQKTTLTPQQADYLKKINSAGSALLSLVNNILDFAKIETGRDILVQRHFTIEELFSNIAAIKGVTADAKGINLTIFVDNNIPSELIGDHLQIGQSLGNIIDNGIKFSPSGTVAVRCYLHSREADQVMLRIIIEDKGIGMQQSQLEQLFVPFVQEDMSSTRKFGGTGIGLGLAKKVIELAKGSINITSEANKGTTVTILVPFTLAKPNTTSCQGKYTPLNGTSLIVVSKDKLFCDATAEMAQNVGCQTTTFSDMQKVFVHLSKTDKTDKACRFVICTHHELEDDNGAHLTHIFDTMKLQTPPEILVIVPLSYEAAAPLPTHRGKVTIVYQPVLSHLLQQMLALHVSLSTNSSSSTTQQSAIPYFPNAQALLVEDNLINQQIAIELLRDVGVTVTVAENGKKALAILQDRGSTAFDIILMDLQMPEMDGYRATELIRKDPLFANVPIIAMTAHATEEEQNRCFELGMNEHVSKPLNVAYLYTVLNHWLPDIETLLQRSVKNIMHDVTKTLQTSETPQLSADSDLVTQLRQLLLLLKDDDAKACALFLQIEQDLYAFDKNATTQAKQAIDVFDFAEALARLEPMANGLEQLTKTS